ELASAYVARLRVRSSDNDKAMELLLSHCGDNGHLSSGQTSAANAWAKLQSHFSALQLQTRLGPQRELNALSPSSGVVDYVHKAKLLCRGLNRCGLDMADLDVVMTILVGLPASYA